MCSTTKKQQSAQQLIQIIFIFFSRYQLEFPLLMPQKLYCKQTIQSINGEQFQNLPPATFKHWQRSRYEKRSIAGLVRSPMYNLNCASEGLGGSMRSLKTTEGHLLHKHCLWQAGTVGDYKAPHVECRHSIVLICSTTRGAHLQGFNIRLKCAKQELWIRFIKCFRNPEQEQIIAPRRPYYSCKYSSSYIYAKLCLFVGTPWHPSRLLVFFLHHHFFSASQNFPQKISHKIPWFSIGNQLATTKEHL